MESQSQERKVMKYEATEGQKTVTAWLCRGLENGGLQLEERKPVQAFQ